MPPNSDDSQSSDVSQAEERKRKSESAALETRVGSIEKSDLSQQWVEKEGPKEDVRRREVKKKWLLFWPA